MNPKQARLREIKENAENFDHEYDSIDKLHIDWLIDQLEVAWRVNAVAREKLDSLLPWLFHKTECAAIQGVNDEHGVECTCGLSEALEKGMK